MKHLIALTLLAASLAWASVPTRGKSSYGSPDSGGATEIDHCLNDTGGIMSCIGAPITFQEFESSGDTQITVFDFMINSLDSYMLTLSTGVGFLDFGAVSVLKLSNNGNELVGPDPGPLVTANPACVQAVTDPSCANTVPPLAVTFKVPSGGAGVVFFVTEEGLSIQDDPTCDPTKGPCSTHFGFPSVPGVSLTPITSFTTPEPASLMLLASALLVAAGVGHRRFRARVAGK